MIKNGVVFNIASWDGKTEWNPDCELVDITEQANVDIEWTFDGKEFSPPIINEGDVSDEDA